MLLNKHNLNIAKLAAKQKSRFTLPGIHVTPKATIVTDGHLLMAVTTVATKAEEFPNREDSGLKTMDEFKPFNLSAEHALKAANEIPRKSFNAVLQCAAVAVNGDPNHPKILTTDLERHSAYPAMESANYPDWERVMPTAENATFTIGLDARKLRALLDQFISLCDADNKRVAADVTFRFTDAKSPVMMETTRNDQTMTGVLMPLRIPETVAATRKVA